MPKIIGLIIKLLKNAKNNMTKKHPEYRYLELLQDILDNGVENIDEGTDSKSLSVFGRQIRFDLAEDFPLLTTKKVYWHGVLHELYWFFSGQSNVKYLIDNNVHIWDDYPYQIYMDKVENGEEKEMTKEDFVSRISSDETFAEKHGRLPNIYGEAWRKWPASDGRKIDQLQWVVDELRIDPDARNTLVTSWNPEFMYAMAVPGKGNRFPICHNLFQVSIKSNKLHLQLYQRSADMFLGVPFNIASYALLTHVLANVLDVKPGTFIHTFGDAHIYTNHIEQVKEQLSREPKPLPQIKIKHDLKKLEDFSPDDVELIDYNPHGVLRGELTVAGGVKKRDIESN